MPAVESVDSSPQAMTRRRWFALCFWFLSSLVALGLAIPVVGYLIAPLFRGRKEGRVALGRVADLPVDEPRRVDFVTRRRDGWVVDEGRQSAWVVRRADDVLVFDPRCTHLNCAYHWHAETRQFLCPCHNGLYDIDGRVVGGPPPRPLDLYAATVEEGSLYVVPTPIRRS